MLFFFLLFSENLLEKGNQLFTLNCSVCHQGGNNLIIPEKNLKEQTLEANGMNSKKAIQYQIRNGKNGMPAFGDRLTKKEIELLSDYILFEAKKNFEKD